MTIEKLELDNSMKRFSISKLRANQAYVKMCEAHCVGMNSIQNAIDYMSNALNVDKASGVWLDYIGWLVGTNRQYFDASEFFKVNSPDLNTEKYFYFPTETTWTQGTLNDVLFRQRIKAKIGYNVSKGTREENLAIIKNMTNADKVIITKTYDFNPDSITVVGSPTITSDGVASGFSSNNYIKTVPVNTISVNNFSISIGFTMGAQHQNVLFTSMKNGSTEYGIAIITNTNKIYGYASSTGSGWDIYGAKIGTTTLVEGVKYLLTLSFNGSQYICKLLNQETGIETVEWTVDNNFKIYVGENPIALGSQAWVAMSGSIDLKQFSITVDGKEVYNCIKRRNKMLDIKLIGDNIITSSVNGLRQDIESILGATIGLNNLEIN